MYGEHINALKVYSRIEYGGYLSLLWERNAEIGTLFSTNTECWLRINVLD
jgi:hypothetical protein